MLGILREGVPHLLLALVVWLLVRWVSGSPDAASWFCLGWFLSREARDWEIEALPSQMRALGFENWRGLQPCTSWDLRQLRHSLSGWVPVTLLCLLALVVL